MAIEQNDMRTESSFAAITAIGIQMLYSDRRMCTNICLIDNGYTGDEMYRGTWVAEVSIANTNGEVLAR